MIVLSMVRPDWRHIRLWDIAPSGPASARLKRECPGYLETHYWPDVAPGTMIDGIRCEDLEHPSLLDGSMDVIVSSDVFEHVIDIDAALGQIARVLTPDGLHVWTTPRISTLSTSKPRVRRGPSGLEYLEPVEVHGDPVCADGAIVTFDWGQDLPARVEAAAGMSTAVLRLESRAHGVIGEFREVFVSHRGLGNPMADLQRRNDAVTAQSDRFRASLAMSEQMLSDVLASKSWRITRPLRTLGRAIRR
jgi:SAM-dependent methyltransferase